MSESFGMGAFVAGFLVIILLVTAGFWFFPTYNVWSSEMHGKAQLAEAEGNRQIAVLEAQAIKDSAQLKAEAEVIRAEGVAKANKIVADGLGGPDGYLRYLYIDMLKNDHEGREIIYVPTEAGLPILEAGKR